MMIQETVCNCIAILVDRRTGREFNISRFATSLGRDIGNDFAMSDDKTVSRQHATISYVDGKFQLIDLGSKNGSRVNGRRIFQQTELKSGDEICIGLTQLIFVLLPGHLLDSLSENNSSSTTETLPKPALGNIPALSY